MLENIRGLAVKDAFKRVNEFNRSNKRVKRTLKTLKG